MRPIIRKTLTTACALAVLGNFSVAFADVTSDTELLLNWAELTYPTIFTSHKTTVSSPPWLYRDYSGVLAGVNRDDNNVYVMGGPFGNSPTVVGPLSTLMVSVNIKSNAEILFNWAEQTYPAIFPSHQATVINPPLLTRTYGAVVVSVNMDNNSVYITGGSYGSGQTLLGPITALLELVNNPTPNTSQSCDATALPAGLTMTQNGNVITISTNGNCIVPPTDQNYCQFDTDQPTQTGISVLTTGVVKNMQMKGVLISVPGVFDQLLQSGLDFKTCVINAPSESAGLTINTNVCYDLTNSFKDIQSIPGYITITPPVQQTLEATAETQTVADCFATDAQTVSDLYTGDIWIKTNGAWVKQPKP